MFFFVSKEIEPDPPATKAVDSNTRTQVRSHNVLVLTFAVEHSVTHIIFVNVFMILHSLAHNFVYKILWFLASLVCDTLVLHDLGLRCD